MITFVHKRGDTFSQTFQLRDETGAVVPMAGWSARSHLRTAADVLVYTFAVSVDTINNEVTVTAPYAATEAWDIGQYVGDLEFTNGSDRRSTDDFTVRVWKDWTR